MVLAPEVRSIVKALKGSNSCEEIAQILECDVESVMSCIRECELLEGKTATLRLPQRPKAAAATSPLIAQDDEKKREVGRPKVLENRQLVERMLTDNPHFTSIDVQRELARHGIEVSRRTLQRRISEIRSKNNQQPRSPSPKKSNPLGLSEEAKRKRLAWAKAHQDWTVRDWRNIFNMDDLKFVDESSPPKEIFLDTLMGPEGSVCSDLNLLEQLMAIIQPRIQNQAPNNVGEFRAVLYDVWHSDQDMVDKIEMLYESMTWRVSAVLRSDGDQTEFC
ncbi:uncharacterized protein LOC108047559 [Drosophila rhopaloa]|uniref:Uncharacterized protein n=1 Tax=Drosophila rhopaloa TaxID=1041015 RepID=A0ABM5HP96_DRORH|nr:uncharacterized protein LOC108047559 [Drosophila rhopaloa]XP_016983281.2 uncharacterized protein LOC108047559 [Drosophila rhopaloa]XP_016983282.2 uncharacterized protein LOC108047559 [Drosophila rhopaloa]XP_016983283.2 uncharacterized protein LOC108047559 [Drosophila rhopaloa]